MVFVFPRNENISNWDNFLVEFPFYTPSLYVLDFLHSGTFYKFGLFVEPEQDRQIQSIQGFKNAQIFDNLEAARQVYPEIE